VDQTKYRDMIESLLYRTVSHPDIMHSVCMFVLVSNHVLKNHS